MRSRFVFALLCALCVSAMDVSAQAAPQTSLQTFAWQIGGTWVAEGEFAGLGKYTAQRSYRWVLEGRFIEMQQVLRTGGAQSVTVGIIGWDMARGHVAGWGFSDDGSMALTECSITSPGDFVFEGRLVGGAHPGPVHGVFHRTGPDGFTETVHAKSGNEWQPLFQFAFSRKQAPLEPATDTNGMPAPELRLLQPLVGAWEQVSEFTNTRITTEVRFHWTLHGRILRVDEIARAQHKKSVRETQQMVSFFGYDAERKSIVGYRFEADGLVCSSRVTSAEGARPIVMEGEQAGRQQRVVRNSYRAEDDGSLLITTEFQQQGIFQVAANMTLHRKP